MNIKKIKLNLNSLGWYIPGILIAFNLLLVIGFIFVQVNNYNYQIEKYIDDVAYENIWAKQQEIEQLLANRDETQITNALADILAEYAIKTNINHAILLDSKHYLLAAHHLGWQGEKAIDLLGNYPTQLVEQVFINKKSLMQVNESDSTLDALAPVFSRNKNKQLVLQGVLYFNYDISQIKENALSSLIQQIGILALLVLVQIIVLTLLAKKYIQLPIKIISASLVAIGEGKYRTNENFKGLNEFNFLNKKVSFMANELNHRAKKLLDSEAKFQQLANASFEGLIIFKDKKIVNLNAMAVKLLNLDEGSAIGQPLANIFKKKAFKKLAEPLEHQLEASWIIKHKNKHLGKTLKLEVSLKFHQGEENLGFLALKDITERIETAKEMHRLANLDNLTGLPNKNFLLKLLAEESTNHKETSAVLATININKFKLVNTSLGMSAGDQILRRIAFKLNKTLKKGETLARFDGDTYALFVSQLKGNELEISQKINQRVTKLLSLINQPLEYESKEFSLNASAGIVIFNQRENALEIVSEAITAMNQAKRLTNESSIKFFAPELQEAANTSFNLRNELKQALKDNEQLELYYQPQVDAAGKLVGLESLIRWKHPEKGLVSPGEFIPEAEASGLILPLGSWVLRQGFSQLKAWHTNPATASWAKEITLALNISPQQFNQPNFYSEVEGLLLEFDLPKGSIELELTESVLAEDLEATINVMLQLKELGIKFALDDFGTGYSSLSYLSSLPLDLLKIDRSFIIDLDQDPIEGAKSPAVLVDAIIAMAHRLGLPVLAEGIETPEQLKKLVQAKCNSYQGFYFSRPLEVAALEDWCIATQS